MEWLTFMDPTALCVAGLILALTLLWTYVMLTSGKKEQPDLSLLYAHESSGTSPKTGSGLTGAGKKNNKTKAKKQGDTSPRALPKQLQSDTQMDSDTPLSPTKTQKTSVQAKDSSVKAGQDMRSKGKVRKSRGVSSKESEEVVKKDETETEEGEWQTQLSRQQLRAMRQKKRQAEDKSSSDSEPTKIEKVASNTEEPSEEVSKSKTETKAPPPQPEKTTYSKGGKRGKAWSKKPRATPVASESDSLKDTEKDTTKTEEAVEDSVSVPPPVVPATGDLPAASLEQRLPSPSLEETGLTEVEKALKEAALSGSSSPEAVEETKEESEFAEVKPKRQKKSKRKNNSKDSSSPDIPSSDAQPVATEQEHDDWVVL